MPTDQRENICHRSNQNSAWLMLVMPAWVISLVVSRLLLNQHLVPPGFFSWLVAFVPMIFGALLLWIYARYMGLLDELWVRIYQRALAFSFGVSVLVLFTYPILELANAPEFNAMAYGAFSLCIFFGSALYCAWRYR